ncbi:DDE_3 domain-containing protein [Trichonephila clavipes]|nr:DDE_3 domain-containing protein [Trichonephila clavipes]
MDVGIYGVDSLKANTLQPLLERSRLEVDDGSIQVHICPYGPCPPNMHIVFPQDDDIYKQGNVKCHTAVSVCAWFEEHQDEFTILPWPANSPDFNSIENLWDHLD